MTGTTKRRSLEGILAGIALCVTVMLFTAGTTGDNIEGSIKTMSGMTEFHVIALIAICCLGLAFFIAWSHSKALREQSVELSKAMREGNDVIRDLISEMKERPCIRKPSNN